MAHTFNTNLPAVAFHYLKQIDAAVTRTGFYKSIRENPFYPSLYSLSDTFNKYNIENNGFEIDPEKLSEITGPFIAYVRDKSNGNDFVSVIAIKKNRITYTRDGNKEINTDLNDFIKDFRNFVFVASLNDQSGEDDYEQKRKKELFHQRSKFLFLLLGGIALLLASFYVIKTSLPVFSSLSVLIIILVGLIFSILLLIFEIDKSNSLIKRICSGVNSKVNCHAVLESNAATFLGISWSEYGFFLFSPLFLFIFLPVIPFHEKIPVLAFVFTITAFYIPFSIYYQYKIVKQWCTLCLAVQIILAAGLIWSFGNYWLNEIYFPAFKASSLFLMVACFIFPIGSWFFLKPVFLRAKDAGNFAAAHKRVLYNPDVFKSILEQQPMAADGWQHLGIDIGNAHAQHTIIKVCHPHCRPCAEAHTILEQIIEQNENIRLKIIFTATNKEHDISSKPAKHMLSIADEKNSDKTKEAIDNWYHAPKKDYDSYANLYPLNTALTDQNDKIDAMRKWCDKTEITFTPTIFINGWRLPEMYDLEELKNILAG